MEITRRRLIGGLAAAGAGAIAAGVAVTALRRSARKERLTADVSQMLMFGFAGSTTQSYSARVLADHIAAGRISTVVFVHENVATRDNVVDLIRLFSPEVPSRVLLAIDHEGGAVQRLGEGQGFTRIPSALSVAETRDPAHAERLYAKAAREFAGIGFSVNLAPVVDLHDPDNPAIGHYGRSFSADPAVVTSYAEAFIDAFSAAGIICAVKHFPGQGRAHGDSHDELPDITANWSEKDLEPFANLIASGRAQLILGGHVRLTTIDKSGTPSTLSVPITTGLLRDKLGFQGVVMTDDLDMKAVSGVMGRREAIIRALAAGNDLLMVRNVEPFDRELPQKIVVWVEEAIDEGRLREADIAAAADRVRKLKQNPPAPSAGLVSSRQP